MGAKPLTVETKDEIIRLWKRGDMTQREIATHVGVSQTGVSMTVRAHPDYVPSRLTPSHARSIRRKKLASDDSWGKALTEAGERLRQVTEGLDALILQARRAGYSYDQIATASGLGWLAVKYICRRAGVLKGEGRPEHNIVEKKPRGEPKPGMVPAEELLRRIE